MLKLRNFSVGVASKFSEVDCLNHFDDRNERAFKNAF